MTDKTITVPQVDQPKGSGSLEFDGLLAAFHAIVWATAEDDDPELAYDEAGNVEAKKLQAMYRSLQSGLTKAREALREIICACGDERSHGYISMLAEDALSNQSAQADKGHGEPVAMSIPSEDELIASGLGYPFSKEEAVQLYYSGFKTEPITVLEAWDAIGHDIGCNPSKDELLDSLRNMAAICDAHGNDMPAEQPATIAVVMPGHRDSDLRSPTYGFARGWNACLDEFARLNPESKP